jgi:hypothetical protein
MSDKIKEKIAGHRPLSAEEIGVINIMKALEAKLISMLLDMASDPDMEIDKRWLNIGRTQLEQAFMAINRSIAKPVPITMAEAEALVGA